MPAWARPLPPRRTRPCPGRWIFRCRLSTQLESMRFLRSSRRVLVGLTRRSPLSHGRSFGVLIYECLQSLSASSISFLRFVSNKGLADRNRKCLKLHGLQKSPAQPPAFGEGEVSVGPGLVHCAATRPKRLSPLCPRIAKKTPGVACNWKGPAALLKTPSGGRRAEGAKLPRGSQLASAAFRELHLPR